MINLEKHREEFVSAMKVMNTSECDRILKCSNLECSQFKHCGDCANAFVDWLLEEYNVDWSQVKPGTNCLVRDYDNTPWYEREFGVFAFGKPWFFVAGSLDSMNKDTSLCTYRYYKLKEDEE